MTDPVQSAVVAVLAGSLIFALALVPIGIVQSRRFGGLSLTRITALGAMFVYGMALVTFTLLPLPTGPQSCLEPHLQLTPFQFLREARAHAVGAGLVSLIRTPDFVQAALNVIFFVPLGVFLRRLLELPAAVCVALGFTTSVLIETTQYTAVFGLFECAWRTTDVDDVITNTAGTILGVVIAPLVLGWVARARTLETRRLRPRPVTRVRHLLALALDGIFFVGCAFVLRVGWAVLGAATGAGGAMGNGVQAMVMCWLPGLLIFVAPALSRTGASFGERLMWLEPRWPVRPIGVGRRVARLLMGEAPAAFAAGLLALGVSTGWPAAILLVWAVAGAVGVLMSPDGLATRLAGGRLADSRALWAVPARAA